MHNLHEVLRDKENVDRTESELCKDEKDVNNDSEKQRKLH